MIVCVVGRCFLLGFLCGGCLVGVRRVWLLVCIRVLVGCDCVVGALGSGFLIGGLRYVCFFAVGL